MTVSSHSFRSPANPGRFTINDAHHGGKKYLQPDILLSDETEVDRLGSLAGAPVVDTECDAGYHGGGTHYHRKQLGPKTIPHGHMWEQ